MTRLRFLADVNPATPGFDSLTNEAEITFVPLEDVWPPPRWNPLRKRPKEEVASGYTRFREGDVLVPKITPTFQAGRSLIAQRMQTPFGAATTEVHVVRPQRVEPRFLNHCFQSRPFLTGGEACMIGVAGQKRVPESWLLDYDISVEDERSQAQIADFLDAETARIDALIEKKRRMVALLVEWEQARLLRTLGDWRDSSSRTLRQYDTDVVTGPFGTQLQASEYVDGGVPLINPTHIYRGRLVPEDRVTVSEVVAQRLSRHRLLSGDIVMGRKGDVGRSAMMPAAAEGWLCGSDSIAIRTNKSKLLPEWLAFLLHVALYRQQLAASSTGAMVTGVNEDILLSLRLPDRTPQEQAAATVTANAVVAHFEKLIDRLERQIELLREHRQALITAAVTGDLDVTKAAA